MKLDKLLCYLYRKTKFLYDNVTIELTPKELAIGYAINVQELDNMIRALADSISVT